MRGFPISADDRVAQCRIQAPDRVPVGDSGGLALTVAAVAAAAFLGLSPAQAPAPNAPLPVSAAEVARALTVTTRTLRPQLDNWRAGRANLPAPAELVLRALYQQRITRLLARRRALATATLPLLGAPLRTFTRDVVAAHRELVAITPPLRPHTLRTGSAAPPRRLLTYYRAAMRRFAVPWNVLAAVNFVESAFGKLRSASAAGAQGPMQFMPATWRAYGLGGNVRRPRDAIMGAANYLRASGAPHNIRRALHAYNPSPLYVDAVLRYARLMRRDLDAFYTFYSWQVFVRTTSGEQRLTGPGVG